MSTNTTNCKPQRKQLADQLDRLDGILDLMAEGLPAAVTESVREGTRLAVKDALIELATNTELRALMTSAVPPSTPHVATAPVSEQKTPGLWSRIKAKLAAARAAVVRVARKATEAVLRRCVLVGETIAALGRATGEALPVRRIVLIGLGVGLMVGVTSLAVPQTTAAVIGGIGATCTAVSVQVGVWLQSAGRRIGLLS